MDSLFESSGFWMFLFLHQSFGDCSKCLNYNWYHSHLHVLLLLLLLLLLAVLVVVVRIVFVKWNSHWKNILYQNFFKSIFFITGCLNIHGIYVTSNNSKNDNVVFVLFQIWKYYAISTINPRSQCIEQERKTILYHYLFRDKIIQNCLKIDTTHLYDNDL